MCVGIRPRYRVLHSLRFTFSTWQGERRDDVSPDNGCACDRCPLRRLDSHGGGSRLCGERAGLQPQQCLLQTGEGQPRRELPNVEKGKGARQGHGSWKVVQKQLLSLQSQTGKLEQELTSALSSAPAKVKTAAQEGIKLVPLELKAIKNSTNVTQFEAAIAKVTSGAKFSHAANVLEAYDTSQCGSN
jgi:hypothetical protein